MAKLRLVGFFSELPHGIPSGGSLRSLLSRCSQENEEKIVNYLRNGKCWVACPGIAKDVLSEVDIIIGAPHTLTDGVWAWPNDLAYYVEKYHITLPKDFMTHLANNEWKVPEVMNLKDLELEAE